MKTRIEHTSWQDARAPGWWIAGEDPWEGTGHVHVRCGDCGRHCGKLTDHTIDPDGTVHASILCLACGWHVFGVLLGWGHGRKASRELVGGAR